MKPEELTLDIGTTFAHTGLVAVVIGVLSCTRGNEQFAWGWLVGTAIGLVDYLIMYRAVVRNLDKSPQKALAAMRKSWMARLAVMTAAALLSIKAGLAMAAVMIAVLAVHAITLLDAIWLAYRRRRG